MARQADPDVPVCFFEDGLDFPETLQYIHDLAGSWQLDLLIVDVFPMPLQYLRATGAWDHYAITAPALLQGSGLHDLLITPPAATAHPAHGEGELGHPGRRITRPADMLLKASRAETAYGCTGSCPPAPTGKLHTQAHRGRHGGITRRRDRTVAFSPVRDWLEPAIREYLDNHRVPVNPLYRRLADLDAPPRLTHCLDR